MVRAGEKGSVEIEMVTRRVQTRLERKRMGPEEWLVVTRRSLAADRTLEPKAEPIPATKVLAYSTFVMIDK
jgi:hypothetical protein